MTLDAEPLEKQLRQRPPIADNGFSLAVLRRIAAHQRRRQQVLFSVWTLATVTALAVISVQFETWMSQLQPLTTMWTAQSGQALSDVSLLFWLQPLWQPTSEMLISGLIALLLTTVFASAWD